MVNNAVPIAPVSGSCVTFFTFLTWIALSDDALVKPACQTEVVGADQLEGRLAGFLVHS